MLFLKVCLCKETLFVSGFLLWIVSFLGLLCFSEGHNVTDLLAVCQCLRLIADHISEDLGSQLEHKATVSQDLEEAAGSLVDSW